jgi:hypothetical protein
LREKDYLEDPDVEGRIILRRILRKWVDLDQSRDRWQALLHAVMNFRVP